MFGECLNSDSRHTLAETPESQSEAPKLTLKKRDQKAADKSQLPFICHLVRSFCDECKQQSLVENFIEGTIVCQECGLVQ
jgi:hypothetical protein